jgi:hypothetical protein
VDTGGGMNTNPLTFEEWRNPTQKKAQCPPSDPYKEPCAICGRPLDQHLLRERKIKFSEHAFPVDHLRCPNGTIVTEQAFHLYPQDNAHVVVEQLFLSPTTPAPTTPSRSKTLFENLNSGELTVEQLANDLVHSAQQPGLGLHETPVKNTFEYELETLINRYSKENDSDTPDFILATYVLQCLDAFSNATKRRDQWYSKE